MNDSTQYRLENIRKKEIRLRHMRGEILSAPSEKSLDMILDAPSPATLVQSFPAQDLYYLLHHIGGDDFVPVLSMAASEQWEYILDIETWHEDHLDLQGMTKTFDLLFQADPQRLLRWVITEKPDYFEFYLFKNMDIRIREHDETPPEDFDDYITLDDKFYFRFPEKPVTEDGEDPAPADHQQAWELIESMMKALTRMDLSVYHGLLLETSGLLPAEVEEEQFRLKNIRLAEKGFLPAHEAIGIYQPVQPDRLRKRPVPLDQDTHEFDPDLPMPPQFFSGIFSGDDRITSVLSSFHTGEINPIENEIAALINKLISADKIKLKSGEEMAGAISKTCGYLNLGLETLCGPDAGLSAYREAVNRHFLEDIFRCGSSRVIRLKTIAAEWFRKSFINANHLPLSFLGEQYLGTLGGLFLERPMYYANPVKGDLYQNFQAVREINNVRAILDQIIALDQFLSLLDVDIATFSQGVLTWQTLILTLWARDRIGLERSLEPIPVKAFKPFFSALFRTGKEMSLQAGDLALWAARITEEKEAALPQGLDPVISGLIREIESEYGSVSPDDIDPRFMPHFFLDSSH